VVQKRHETHQMLRNWGLLSNFLVCYLRYVLSRFYNVLSTLTGIISHAAIAWMPLCITFHQAFSQWLGLQTIRYDTIRYYRWFSPENWQTSCHAG